MRPSSGCCSPASSRRLLKRRPLPSLKRMRPLWRSRASWRPIARPLNAYASGRMTTMTQERLAYLIHAHTTAIAALERRISTHEAICRILRVLALEEITLGQALGILAETTERSDDPEQQWLYLQSIDTLRPMQSDES